MSENNNENLINQEETAKNFEPLQDPIEQEAAQKAVAEEKTEEMTEEQAEEISSKRSKRGKGNNAPRKSGRRRKDKSSNKKTQKAPKNTEGAEGAEGEEADVKKKFKIDKPDVKPHARRVIFLTIVSVAFFVASIAIQYLYTNVLTPTNENAIVNWMFVTGQSNANVENTETFMQAEAANPISKPLGDSYVRTRIAVPGDNVDQILKVTTEYSPMKVILDGESIYDNGYEKQSMVGNCYNEVVIPGSTEEQVLELYIYYPLSFNLQAELTPVTDTGLLNLANFSDNWPIFAGGVMFIGGVIMLLTIFCFMFRSKDIVNLGVVGAIVLFCGASILVRELSVKTALVTSPMMFSALVTINGFIAMLAVLAVHSCMSAKKAFTRIMAILIPVSTFACWIPTMTIVLQAGLILTAVFVVIAGIFLFKDLIKPENLIVDHHSAIEIVGIYTLISYAFNCVAFATGLWNYSVIMFVLATVVFCVMFYITYMRKVALNNLAKYSKEKQVDDYYQFFEAVSNIISEPYGIRTSEEYIVNFCEKASEFLINSELLADTKEFRCCAAMNHNGKYVEVYNPDKIEDCNYTSMVEHLKSLDDRYTVGSSFIEMMFGNNPDQEAVIFFENTYNKPESGLKNFIFSLYSSVSVSYENLHMKSELFSSMENMFINMAGLAEERATGTGDHLITVSKMTTAICKKMGYDESTANLIGTASMVHDIGKISIPEEILGKRGSLTDDEMNIMRQHIIYGYNILSGVEGQFFDIAKMVVLQHHENYDGTGYMGKRGTEISIYARIVKVVDVFDALVSSRAYKQAWDYEEAISYIVERQGTEFDPDVVKAFLASGMELIEIKENSKLSDNTKVSAGA